MKKITAFLTAITLMLSVTGCWKGSEKNGSTFEVNLDQSYVSEQVIVDGKSTSISPVCTTDKGVFLQYYAGRNYQKGVSYVTVFYDAATGEYTKFEPERTMSGNKIVPMSDGRFAVLYCRDFDKKNWEYEEDYLWDIYDSDMQYLETLMIPEVLGENNLQYCQAQFNSKDELVYVAWMGDHYSIIVLDAQMQEKHILSSDDYSDVIAGADGEIYIVTIGRTTVNVARVDTEQGKFVPIQISGDIPEWNANVLSGSSGYTLYLSAEDGIYGITIDGTEGTCEKKVDFVNSDFLDAKAYSVISVPDGGFLWEAGNDSAPELWLAHERTPEETENTQLISLAGINLDKGLKEVVCNYNRSQNDYRIVMVDYMDDPRWREGFDPEEIYDYSKTQDAAEAVFWQDLLNGVVPDMLCTDQLPFQQLAGKGMFADLSEYMEKDERFHEEDYVMNYFDSMKYKGQLLTMGFSFTIETVAGKTKFVGDSTALSPEEYLNLINNRPEGMLPMRNSFREWYMEGFLKNMQSSFMNTEAATCSFDSPAFTALLEIGKEMPETSDGYISFEGREMMDDSMLLMNSTFYNGIGYHQLTAGFFGTEDITLVGYPVTGEGNGGIFQAPFTVSVNAQSQYQEQAWNICMELLSENFQKKFDLTNQGGTMSFPVLRSALEEDLHAATLGLNRVTYTNAGQISTGNATEDEMTILMDYIENMHMFLYTDPQIETIITEEAEKFFAGDQTAQEAANMIQSRASLYISEQY